jgi:DMSO/TMAO reductase YedYZ molybdopterin-dependent catalytic subunit
VGWLPIGPHPVWGYRVTQGTHVISGTLMLPLLLAKLFSAYPRLFAWPPIKGVISALDRASVALLIASTAFQIATGLLDTAQWYPWHFGFVATHFAVAWIAIGALCIHVGLKLPVIQRALSRPLADDEDAPAADVARRDAADLSPATEEPLRFGADPAGRTRRTFLLGVAVVTAGAGLLTAGETISPLRKLAWLAPRRPDVGPLHLPINRTAAAAGVLKTAVAPDWTLKITGPAAEVSLTRAQLTAMVSHHQELPISCVEGWSANAHWTGVRMRDLVALVGGTAKSTVKVESLEQSGGYARSELPADFAHDERTLLALHLNGAELTIDHGYPARIIAPNRPGVLQTKWVSHLTVGRAGD